ncbi:PREDICTED: tetratricopeptide repeat protein 19 homolog, mitochondrial, partial [Ceratosolen solmsi marchali]|uniref:Tetratricopeptide repeat protein 19 homolog, mitochondrial n=1 Tax=Ceratosolen solmsi marchali TaxID=326594 RepID=A0AAJ6YXL6_9HYME
MLHIALRIAQTEQNQDGITYIYDLMANLAFETEDYDKAQKLFKAVMQRIIMNGAPEDDLRIVTMSLKLAKILEHRGDYLNAENGYQYCLKILQKLIDEEKQDDNVVALWEVNVDWYAHMLLAASRYSEAMKYMEKAYVACVKHNGETHEQSVVLLNDLGLISFMKGNLDDALHYLNKAVEIGEKLPNMDNVSSIHVNLGNVYMKKGLINEAKHSCLKGWKLSKKINNKELLEEANLCLKEVNK